ncbi:SDR family NAD(P)-dependent oxidoreductase [Actinomadura sp. 9N215]|uniref:SDR family NAD(P)-dependent oxidoreductase n=1 Tax=Actinomadura sp. 9N215 TaxID=3375150 RepID=UPI0037B58442
MASTTFHGRAVIITGGGTGIGRATAHRFAALGADVLVVGRTATRLKETADGHPTIRTLVADLATPEAAGAIAATAVEEFGRIDVLVNNAAIYRPAPLEAIDLKTAEEELATNLLAPILLAQQALPHLATSGGVIVNVTTSPPQGGLPNNSVYGSTKVALDFLTRTWAVELAPRGIRVVSVAPGSTQTPVLVHAGLSEEQITATEKGVTARIPLGRLARPDEIAWWITTAAGPEAGYVTGAVVHVDGGLGVS